MNDFIKSLAKKAGATAVNTFAPGLLPAYSALKNISTQPVRPQSAQPTAAMQPAQTSPVTSNNAATIPAVKTPAAQAYIKSQSIPAMSNAPSTSISNTVQTTPVPQTPPVVPQNATGVSSAKDAYIQAYKTYQDAQRNNTDVANAKTAYNDYVTNIAKSKAGLEGRGLGIPLQIVRGEQAKLLAQTQPEAERLQGDINIAQGTQDTNINAAKSGLDLRKDLLGIERDDASATVKNKSEADKFAYQKEQDNLANDLAIKKFNEDVRQFGIKTALDNQKLSLEQNKTSTPGNLKETQAERNALGFYLRGKDAVDTMGSLEGKIQAKKLPGQIGLQILPNFLQSSDNQVYRQLQRQFTEARLRKESGAAIPKDEYQKDSQTYFAQPGDTPEALARKQAAREIVLESLKLGGGNALKNYYGSNQGGNTSNIITAPDGTEIELTD